MHVRVALSVLLVLALLPSAALCRSHRATPAAPPAPVAADAKADDWGTPRETVRRAAFDFGSGSMKMRVHDVVVAGHRVVSSTPVAGGEHSVRVDFEADLRLAKDGAFSDAIAQQAVDAATRLREKAEKLGAKEFAGLATDAWRVATNGKAVLRRIWQETKINVRISSIEEEARLGFLAAKAALGVDERKLVVWDVGGGQVTFTCIDETGGFVVWPGYFGSVALRDAITHEVQRKRAGITSPNPISERDYRAAQALVAREARKGLPPFLAAKLAARGTIVVGVGPAHFNSVRRQVPAGRGLSQSTIEKTLKRSLGKTDAQIGGQYADTDVSNLILVHGYMRALNLREYRAANVNVADGVLYALYYW